ncbi:MAG: hypothetical protein ACRDTM_05275 [Micromonosporaceae bacterium]
MFSSPWPVRLHRFPYVFVVALFAGLLLAGCSSGSGTTTSCNLDSCTITFDRGVDAKTEVLGVEVKLVEVEGENVTLEVAGTEVTTKVGQTVDVQGFQVEVQEITESNVKVKVSRGDGG